jgi:fructose-1,6-bisphosphatase/inositol monophosphatase family enzyme
MESVGVLLQEVSAAVIEPRFAALRDGDVRFKSAGEVVTVADEQAEDALRRGLGRLDPGTAVVGEEAASAEPALLSALRGERAWLVDPLDGTANFVAGRRWPEPVRRGHGVLIAQEAGAFVRRPDGSPYRPGQNSAGLLAASGEQTWRAARDVLLGP